MTELIIIKTNNGKEIKKILEEKNIDYEVYQAESKQKISEKELAKAYQETQQQKKEKEKLMQQLIKGYQNRTRNKDLQKILRNYGEMSWEDISTELIRREKKNGQK
ncbi:MAG: hypothetical protein I3273_06320 [Candidatus Moeniiplasma glomeromycotorum]|nr:hypothetical protein [Candidatus Moeniiplasma glomeromycotorum]